MPQGEVNEFGHENNEMWLYTNDSQWIEQGLGRHCNKPPVAQSCADEGGSDDYLQFWADIDTSGNEHFHDTNNFSADGNNHVYEIWDDSNCATDNYKIFLDYNQVNTSTNQTNCKGTALNAGMELFNPDQTPSNDSSGTFHNYVEIYLNSEGYWHNVTFDTQTNNDVPCGFQANCAMDDCSAFGPTNCLWWALDSNGYEWSDQKR